ncbi:hypothetical protein Pan44_51020 [Caulifigura coniformis]|uniref:Uncharacterized protein n=1 Tax=Caulifigura coniformis TaxID=2527983 RepID=A0A517SLN4_9PLAN|nr:hypothetical protein [Caulifigura coniformis]QDT57037.1 hypothetical protein Pan44_51020 [Caulifigura coniformis]
MNTFTTLRALFPLLLATAFLADAAPLHAQQNGTETIAFRLVEWKASHFNNPADAQKHAEQLRQLGCEVAVDQHDGHIDVRTRTGGWKSVTLGSHALCDQWEAWLKSAGFETLHGHGHAPAAGSIAVQFQQPAWRTQHFNNQAQAQETALLFKALGCEVQEGQHAGHFDLTVRCTTARTLTCASHDQAHALQNWLNQNGFQTQHAH